MTSETPTQEPNKPEEKEPGKSKLSETLDTLKKNEKIETLFSYAKSNTMDTIAYVLLILGIVFLFFREFYGGVMIGLVVGVYFSNEIISLVKDCNGYIEKQGMVKSLIVGGTLLALFISAPGIFIGAAIAAGLKYLIAGSSQSGGQDTPS